MELIRDRERKSGICGEITDFTDSLGNKLYVGDIVVLVDKTPKFGIRNTNIVVKDSETGEYEIMGLYGEARNGFINNSDWNIYRAIPYNEVPEGFIIDGHKYVRKIKEMTISEIEKELGYSIKIIKED